MTCYYYELIRLLETKSDVCQLEKELGECRKRWDNERRIDCKAERNNITTFNG